ncbi:MAG: hypothetical protein Q7T11_05035 [Deltaproteobacteria bacterium]|nr:hypothetical protein [Deltaproteobacteria bacterium]
MKKKKRQSAEQKGDAQFRKKKFREALKHYRKAATRKPNEPVLYGKLVKTLDQIKGDWTEKEFAESLDWTMKEQELKHPEARRIRNVLELLQTFGKKT